MAAAAALALLAGCAEAPPDQSSAANSTAHHHMSPPAVEPPELPEGSFDLARAKDQLSAAQAARQAGQADRARPLAEAAINSWPADADAWRELDTDCQALGDQQCRSYAAFFLAKLDYVASLPARAAVLGFQNIAEEPIGTVTGGITYDQKTIDMAFRLWAFYNTQDPMKARLAEPDSETFAEKYPYAPALLISGVVGGVLTISKSVANK